MSTFAGEVLPAKKTSLNPDVAVKAISDGYKIQTGKKPNAKVLGLLAAQSAHETDDWKRISNFNFAGIKASAGDRYVQNLRCFERDANGQIVWYEPGDPHCIFAAFKTAADGAARYIQILQKRPHWWAGLQSGSVSGFTSGLITPPYKYFTADPHEYEQALERKLSMYGSLAKKYSSSIAGGLLITGLLAGGGYLGWKKFKHG